MDSAGGCVAAGRGLGDGGGAGSARARRDQHRGQSHLRRRVRLAVGDAPDAVGSRYDRHLLHQLRPRGEFVLLPDLDADHDLFDAGNEVGGHTLHHVDLTKLSTTEAQHEVKQIVQDCGYTSGRDVGNINSISVCTTCPYAETIPPRDPFALRTLEPATSITKLSDLQTYVTNAENNGGGWLILVFHGICDNSCTSSNSLSPAIFTAFLDWLQPRSASGTVVQTVGQVMSGTPPPLPGPDTTPPTTSISCNGTSCSGWFATAPMNVALSATDTGGSGVAQTVDTTDGTDPAVSGSATLYTGPFAVTETTMVRFYSTDVAGNVEQTRSQQVAIDTAAPTVSITQPADGSSYRRNTSVLVAANAADSGTGSGAPSGVARVTFYLDGTNELATVTSSPYQFTWKIRPSLQGLHTLTAVATDVAGKSATSAPVRVTIQK
jgi:hypothetical protein